MKKLPPEIIYPILLIWLFLTGCSSVSSIPGDRLTGAGKVYLLGLREIPYMIFLSAEEPKERSRSFSLTHRVSASSTLLYPATIRTLNKKALVTFQKVLGEKIRRVPDKLKKIERRWGGSRSSYRYKKFDCDYYIQLRFSEKRRQPRALYKIRGSDFLKGAYPVYPDGPQLLLEIHVRNVDTGKFQLAYRKSLDLFLHRKGGPDSLAPMNESFTWHIAYASGEKQLRFDFRKHVTILRSAVIERITTFLTEEASLLEKALP